MQGTSSAPSEGCAAVLVVDDRPAVQAELVAALEPLGLNIVRAEPGPDLDTVLEQNVFVVAFVGTHPGRPDPTDTIRAIQEQHLDPILPVLLVADSDRGSLTDNAGAPGVLDCLPRPFAASFVRAKVGALAEFQHQIGEAMLRMARKKDDYVALVAQELREQLNTALEGLGQLERLVLADHHSAAAARSVGGELRRLETLIDAIGDDCAAVRQSADRLDLARVVRIAARDLRPTLAQAGLRLDVSTTATPLWIAAERTRIEQVVGQLLDVVAKRAGSGGAMRVAARADSAKGVAVVRIDKTSTGPGLELRDRQRGWPDRADAEHRLVAVQALLQAIALRAGGSIAADDLSSFSEIALTLPIAGEPPALSAMPERAPGAGRRRRVLVVEDNRDAAASLCVLLELMGHDVRVAYTGPEGVATAAEWTPEIIISDIGLPGFDGFEVARRLRRQLGTKPLLVALTGYGRDEDRRHSREAGFDHHLIKPADPAVLQQMLATAR
jgi:CheY-like chemotaxis protein